MDPRDIFGKNPNQKGKRHFVFKLKINIWTVLLGILFVLFFLPLAISFVELSREEGKVDISQAIVDIKEEKVEKVLVQNEKVILNYKDGTTKTPVVVHRVVYGSLERFIGIITEHFAGAFPVWISPVQIKILPITERNLVYAKKVFESLKGSGVRVELDERNETLQAKIRDAQEQKIPYMLIIGDKEESAKKVAVRLRTGEDLGQMTEEALLKRVEGKIEEKSLDL